MKWLFILICIGVTLGVSAQDDDVLKEKPIFDQFDRAKTYPIQEVEQLLQDATRKYRNRYYDKAIKILDRLVEKYPSIDYAWFLLGKIWGSQKADPDRALEALHKAVELQPDSIQYKQELAVLYHRLQRFPPALELLDDILEAQPNDELAIYRKAVIDHKQGKIDEALELVQRIPEFEHARVLHAILIQQQGGDAQPMFKSIVHDFPHNIRARYEYAKGLLRQRKLDEAQKIFEAIIDEDPFYQHALFQLIKIYQSKKWMDKAKLAKQSLDTINRIGRDKRNFYRSFLRHHPDTAETHFQMGLIYLEIGRGNLAAGEFQQALERDSNHSDASFYLAQVHMASSRFAEAIPYLQKCLDLNPNRAPIHSLIAQCYLETGDGEKAIEHLNEALKIDPKDPLALRLQALWKQVSIHHSNQ